MPVVPHIILLHGNDEFAIEVYIEKLCSGLGDPVSAEMNISQFDGRNGLDFEALNTAVNAAPFLAPRRIVVVAHPIAALNSPEARKKYLGLLVKAPDTTTIVLAEYYELKEDKKKGQMEEHWLVKWAAQSGPHTVTRIYNQPGRLEMPRWIENETKKQGGKIDRDAAAHLTEMVAEDTRIAAQELTKLLNYVNFERPISLLDVERVSIASAQGNIFELVDALGQGDGSKAQRTLHELLEHEEAFEFWGMVIRQFRLLLQTRELLDENANILEIQKSLGLHPFVAQKVANQAKRFSLPSLEAIYHKLLEIDEGVKTSQMPLDVALDNLIVELTPTA